MAAETLTGTRAASTVAIPNNNMAGSITVNHGSYEIAAAVEDGDIFELFYVPDGAVVINGHFFGDDLDTGTEALDMDIGWAANSTDSADPDGFGNLGVISGDADVATPEVGISYGYFGVLKDGPQVFTQGGGNTMVQVEANVAANAGHTGTIWSYAMYIPVPQV